LTRHRHFNAGRARLMQWDFAYVRSISSSLHVLIQFFDQLRVHETIYFYLLLCAICISSKVSEKFEPFLHII